jgi:hypothetical protein
MPLLLSARAESICLPCQENEYFSDHGVCLPCPQGLWCKGNDIVEPKTINSVWTQRDGIYLLTMCPIGHRMISAENGLAAAASQHCQPCSQGQECTSPPCHACTPCMPGYYKEPMYLGSCLKCPTDTYNANEGGDDLETSCIKCPDQSSTNGKKGSTNVNDCECKKELYPVNSALTGQIEMICMTCPTGAVCPDKTCALRSPVAPGRYCNQSQDMLLGDLNEWDGVKWVNVTLRVKDTLLAPPPREDAGVAILERFLYVYGGTGNSGGQQPAGSLERAIILDSGYNLFLRHSTCALPIFYQYETWRIEVYSMIFVLGAQKCWGISISWTSSRGLGHRSKSWATSLLQQGHRTALQLWA